jgi:hypothetical protein
MLNSKMMNARLKLIKKVVVKVNKQKLKEERLAMKAALRDMRSEYAVEENEEDYNF